jgi:hypothetical protein
MSLHQVYVTVLHTELIASGYVTEVQVHPVIGVPGSTTVFYCSIADAIDVDFCSEWE